MSIQIPVESRTEVVAVHLTPGKLNAVRAAFKAGVEPSQIARQFGLSQSDVRKRWRAGDVRFGELISGANAAVWQIASPGVV
jgi:hypothetical protein